MIDARSPFFFDNDSDEDPDNNLEHVDDEPDDWATDLSGDEEELGGNPKYTIEILELLQGLQREWPDDVWFVFLVPISQFLIHGNLQQIHSRMVLANESSRQS
jgi:hypothetical protein